MANSLKIMHLNINGLRNKIHELANCLMYQAPDVLALSESRLDSAVPDSLLRIEGYNFIRKDRTRPGGGLVVYFKTQFNASVDNSLSLDECEFLSFSLTLNAQQSTLSALVVYRPPQLSLGSFLLSFEQFLNTFCLSNSLHCILGDFNLDLLNNSISSQRYRNILTSYALKQVIKSPTRITCNKNSLIDHVIIKNKITQFTAYTLNCSFSDHQGTAIIFKGFHINNTQSHDYLSYRSFKNFSKFQFQTEL